MNKKYLVVFAYLISMFFLLEFAFSQNNINENIEDNIAQEDNLEDEENLEDLEDEENLEDEEIEENDELSRSSIDKDSEELLKEAIKDQNDKVKQGLSSEMNTDDNGLVKMSSINVENFENADLWYGAMPMDQGLIRVKKTYGAPKVLRDENAESSKFVLGVKVNFLKRNASFVGLFPPREYIVPGYGKKITVWVKGSGLKHKLFAVIRDMEGSRYKIPFGEMNFTGWEKMEALVPKYVVQESNYYKTFYRRRGIVIETLFIEFDPEKALGSFYVYFDNLKVESNVFVDEQEIKMLETPQDKRYIPLDDW